MRCVDATHTHICEVICAGSSARCRRRLLELCGLCSPPSSSGGEPSDLPLIHQLRRVVVSFRGGKAVRESQRSAERGVIAGPDQRVMHKRSPPPLYIALCLLPLSTLCCRFTLVKKNFYMNSKKRGNQQQALKKKTTARQLERERGGNRDVHRTHL